MANGVDPGVGLHSLQKPICPNTYTCPNTYICPNTYTCPNTYICPNTVFKLRLSLLYAHRD